MPARIRKVKLDQKHKDSIRASQLLNRLTKHAFGEVQMSVSQVNAADKALSYLRPKMAAVEHSGEMTQSYVVRMPNAVADLDEWRKQQTDQSPSVASDLTTH